ncbi:TetR family transcriptional regulator [Nocardia jiangxiensis]|uniref:TetR family transcriptional regulator n=1 Tax=Nocardia jiangxiensis TaxID=282685 RepID=UPI0002E84729|nr:TetR family transcriptional regulator [Nocardia jiangxiensis]
MAYDSAATKERILAAATVEFAEYGIAGARVDRIVTAARVNKRAIYDYFGDKKALFAVVLEQSLTELARAVPLDESDLGNYAARLFDYHEAHPQALRLVMWEALEMGDDLVPDEPARTEHYADKVRAARGAMGQGGGDPRALVFLILAIVDWSLALPQLRRMLFGSDYSTGDLRPVIVEAARVLTAHFARVDDRIGPQSDSDRR